MKLEYIDKNVDNWTVEFRRELGIMSDSGQDELISAAAYTIAFHIADNFEGGKYRAQILKMMDK